VTPDYCSTLWDLFRIPRTFNLENVWYKVWYQKPWSKVSNTLKLLIPKLWVHLKVFKFASLHSYTSLFHLGEVFGVVPCLGLFPTHFPCFTPTLFMIPKLRSQHKIWIINFISCPTNIELITLNPKPTTKMWSKL